MGVAQHVGVVVGGCGQHSGNKFADDTLKGGVETGQVCSEVGGVLVVGGAFFSALIRSQGFVGRWDISVRKFVVRSREAATRWSAQNFCKLCDFRTVAPSATCAACLYLNRRVAEQGVLTTMRGKAASAASPETGEYRLAAVLGCRRCLVFLRHGPARAGGA